MEGTKIDRLRGANSHRECLADALIETIIEVYVQMMLVDGVFAPIRIRAIFSSIPRVGSCCSTGMVIRVEQETRSRLISTVMSAVRQDVDGVIADSLRARIAGPRSRSWNGSGRRSSDHEGCVHP